MSRCDKSEARYRVKAHAPAQPSASPNAAVRSPSAEHPIAVRLTGCTAVASTDARELASGAQPGIHSCLLNVHSRIVADRSIRYAGDDPTFVEQSARIVPHRDRGDDQGFGSQHLDEGVELRNNSGCEGGR